MRKRTLLCGAARRVITPPLGTLLYGYRPDIDSRSVHDDLTASSVAFGTGEPDETVLLYSLTLGDIQTALCDEMRDCISESTGITRNNIIIAATHTHCAPNTSGVEGWGDIDRPFVDKILMPAVTDAAREALDSMRPAELGVEVGESRVGINRRQQLRDGNIVLGQNPWGCYDPNMTVIVIREAGGGKGIVNLIHYGCHGTACGDGHEITRDWSGVMIDRMEQQTGTMTVYFNGAIGDVGPRLSNGATVGDITHVEELGSLAALDAMRILRTVRTFRDEEMILYKGEIRLPYREYPELSYIESELKKIDEPDRLVNCDRLHYAHLRDMKTLLADGVPELPEPFAFKQTLLRLGDIVFVPFPFEPFAEISMRLRAYSPLRHTLMLSCCNGYMAYLPSEDQLCRGGYEVDVFRYANINSLADDTDSHIITENLRILSDY